MSKEWLQKLVKKRSSKWLKKGQKMKKNTAEIVVEEIMNEKVVEKWVKKKSKKLDEKVWA